MHRQLFTCVLLILYVKERKQQGEKREKQEQICRINEQVDRTAPQLCVIHGIWKKRSRPDSPPAPQSMGLPKEAPFTEVKENAAQRENQRGRALRTRRASPSDSGAGVSLPELGAKDSVKNTEEESEYKAHPSARELTDRRHVRSDAQRKDSLIPSRTQDWAKISIGRQRDGFFQVSFIWPLAHFSPVKLLPLDCVPVTSTLQIGVTQKQSKNAFRSRT